MEITTPPFHSEPPRGVCFSDDQRVKRLISRGHVPSLLKVSGWQLYAGTLADAMLEAVFVEGEDLVDLSRKQFDLGNIKARQRMIG